MPAVAVGNPLRSRVGGRSGGRGQLHRAIVLKLSCA